jgi:hypothetical protein
MSFSAELVARLGWRWDDGAVDDDDLSMIDTFADGTDVEEAEGVWHKEAVAILNGASVTYDLTALTRTVLGQTLSTVFYTIRAILVKNTTAAGEGIVVVGGAASNEWSECFAADGDKVQVPRDSVCLLSNRRCGWEVDDTHKNLKLAALGGDVTFDIAIIGTTSIATGDCSSSGI